MQLNEDFHRSYCDDIKLDEASFVIALDELPLPPRSAILDQFIQVNLEEQSRQRKRAKNISNLLISGYPYNLHSMHMNLLPLAIEWTGKDDGTEEKGVEMFLKYDLLRNTPTLCCRGEVEEE